MALIKLFSPHTILIFLFDSRALLGPQHDLICAYFGPDHKSTLVRHGIVIISLAKIRIMFDPAFRAVLRIYVLVVQIAAVVVLVSMLLELLGAGIIGVGAIISVG